MADEPISALTLLTSYSIADEIEILDVSDTTFASTGTNKRIPFSTLLTMAGVGTVAGGGTGLTSAGSADQLLGVQHVGGGLEYKTLTAGANITDTPAAGSITIAASGGGGGSGTVTSVGLSLPPFITVTGSPVSTSGTLTGTLATQTANTHFSGPTSGSAAAPTFRALVAADLPSITYGAIQNESASTFLGNPTGSPASPSEIGLYPNLGFVGSSLRGSVPIWAATGPGTALVSSSALTSILTGAIHRLAHDTGQHAPDRQPAAVCPVWGLLRYHYQLADANCQASPGRNRHCPGDIACGWKQSIKSSMVFLRHHCGALCSSNRQQRQNHRAIHD